MRSRDSLMQFASCTPKHPQQLCINKKYNLQTSSSFSAGCKACNTSMVVDTATNHVRQYLCAHASKQQPHVARLLVSSGQTSHQVLPAQPITFCLQGMSKAMVETWSLCWTWQTKIGIVPRKVTGSRMARILGRSSWGRRSACLCLSG